MGAGDGFPWPLASIPASDVGLVTTEIQVYLCASMLRELSHITPDHGLRRRWFEDDYFDLIVWLDARPEIVRFQLCYDKRHDEHALTWQRHEGFTHARIDTGSASVWETRSPTLRQVTAATTIGDARLARALRDHFAERSTKIDPVVAHFVRDKLVEYVATVAP